MDLPRVKTELSAQYVDHGLLQTDFRNADDHVFLHSACRKFGVWFSRPGNGASHPVHTERFGRPGATLLVLIAKRLQTRPLRRSCLREPVTK